MPNIGRKLRIDTMNGGCIIDKKIQKYTLIFENSVYCNSSTSPIQAKLEKNTVVENVSELYPKANCESSMTLLGIG